MTPDNPFLPLSFIAGPAILTNATAVLLNGASIRYNLAIGLWRDLKSHRHGSDPTPTAVAFSHNPKALRLSRQRISLIVMALNLLYTAMGGFGVSTLTGLAGAMLVSSEPSAAVRVTKIVTVAAGSFGMVCLLLAAATFILESRCTIRLLRADLNGPTPDSAI